jgi:Ras-related protein Rab-5C
VVGDTKLEIWDTAGQENYEGLAKLYYRGAHAAIIVYDLTQPESLKKSRDWFKKVMTDQPNEDIVVALAGNKSDAPREDKLVDIRRAEEFARSEGLIHVEVRLGLRE